MWFVRYYNTRTTSWTNTNKYDFWKALSLNVFISFGIDYILYISTRLSLDQVDASFEPLLLTQRLNQCSSTYLLLAFSICSRIFTILLYKLTLSTLFSW